MLSLWVSYHDCSIKEVCTQSFNQLKRETLSIFMWSSPQLCQTDSSVWQEAPSSLWRTAQEKWSKLESRAFCTVRTMEKQGWIPCLRYKNDQKGVWDEDTLLASAKIGAEFLNNGLKIYFWHRGCGDHRRGRPWRSTLQSLCWHFWTGLWLQFGLLRAGTIRRVEIPHPHVLGPCKQLQFISDTMLHCTSTAALLKSKKNSAEVSNKTPWSWKPFISSQQYFILMLSKCLCLPVQFFPFLHNILTTAFHLMFPVTLWGQSLIY